MSLEIDLSILRRANRRRQEEWDLNGVITVEYSAIELAGEIGELLNVVKKISREKMGLRGSRATTKDLEQEFGDALITLDLLAMRMNVDLTLALRKTFNAKSAELGLNTKI
jgi:NTP pyrophosphatase (non-canonical NTP hydrolase)